MALPLGRNELPNNTGSIEHAPAFAKLGQREIDPLRRAPRLRSTDIRRMDRKATFHEPAQIANDAFLDESVLQIGAMGLVVVFEYEEFDAMRVQIVEADFQERAQQVLSVSCSASRHGDTAELRDRLRLPTFRRIAGADQSPPSRRQIGSAGHGICPLLLACWRSHRPTKGG